jgi:hypothetical protein
MENLRDLKDGVLLNLQKYSPIDDKVLIST